MALLTLKVKSAENGSTSANGKILPETSLGLKVLRGVPWNKVQSGIETSLYRNLRKNFDTEGMHLRGKSWQSLSDMTMRTRLARGYGGFHPILVQSGQLRSATLDGFRDYASPSPNWSMSASGVSAVKSYNQGKFHFVMNGEKVQNQNGGFNGMAIGEGGKVKRYGAGFLPARPFLFLEEQMISEMAQNISARLIRAAFPNGEA